MALTHSFNENTDIKKLGERVMPSYLRVPNSSGLYIYLYFYCQTIRVRWLTDEQGYRRQRVSGQVRLTWTDSASLIHNGTYSGMDEVIRSQIQRWPADRQLVDRMLEKLVTEVKLNIDQKDSSSANNVMDFYVKVVFRVDCTQVVTFCIDRILQRSMDMIPAADLSIQSLESKPVSNATSCPICIDEISAGDEAVFLPCEHPFHRNCITNWLRASHQCPICRYKMPTS